MRLIAVSVMSVIAIWSAVAEASPASHPIRLSMRDDVLHDDLIMPLPSLVERDDLLRRRAIVAGRAEQRQRRLLDHPDGLGLLVLTPGGVGAF